jgi:hypothetical protein
MSILAVPLNLTPPVISGTTTPGQTLTTTNGTWSNNPTSYTYQWNRDGLAINGATSNQYAVVGADRGHALTCTVTATNGTGLSGVAGAIYSATFDLMEDARDGA